MSRRIRSIVLVTGTVCFLAMASGLILYLHLTHVRDVATHDASHCPLCQQLLATKKSYTIDIGPTEVEIDQVGRILESCPESLCSQTPARSFRARAPPA